MLADVARETMGQSSDERWRALLPFQKRALWDALLVEQGGVCAYCCSRLLSEQRIEHWAPRALRPDGVLDYDNLLAVCSGARVPAIEHCDRRKRARPMTLSPLAEDHMGSVRFDRDGDITFVGENAALLEGDAETLLGLNEPALSALRARVFRGVWDALKRARANADVDRLRREMTRWQGAEAAREAGISEYAEAVSAWLRQEIERLEANLA